MDPELCRFRRLLRGRFGLDFDSLSLLRRHWKCYIEDPLAVTDLDPVFRNGSRKADDSLEGTGGTLVKNAIFRF